MTILRTDSKCEHEDILHDVCVFAKSDFLSDDLTDDYIYYEGFSCRFDHPVFRCSCYISDKVKKL